jgi:hypothetical protein
MKLSLAIAAVAIGLMLSSCGGGDNETTTTTSTPTVEAPSGIIPPPAGAAPPSGSVSQFPPAFIECMADQGVTVDSTDAIHAPGAQQAFYACLPYLHGG